MACTIATESEQGLDNLLTKFWQLDEVASHDRQLTNIEKKCEAAFNQNTQQNNEGRFIVKIPFTDDASALGESKQMALNRFLKLEQRLNKQPSLRAEYVSFMREYEKLGHLQEIQEDQLLCPNYFLPHHCVLKSDSTTTKLRVVFDASAKTSTGISLNEIMHKGPVVQSELAAILMRFRMPRFIFTTDVEKMYRQIQIHPDDRRFQNIWWREHPNEKLRLLQLSTVTYGTRAAPYLATKCLQTLAIKNKSKYPLGAAALETDFYVDDGLCGANTITEAVEIKNQLINILSTAGFKLRKWSANHKQLLHGIAPEDQEVDLNLLDEEHTSVKTLGIIWLPKTDQFQIKMNTTTDQQQHQSPNWQNTSIPMHDDDINQLKAALKTFQQQEELPANERAHHQHHFVIEYLALGLSILILCIIIVRYTHKRRKRNNNPVPQPRTRQQQSQFEIDVEAQI
ncbi:uncharacterized protein LOC119677696 [Teleopsis dalmanni]|uniref:uncharacterized protein LOC119677696 n=1 Tax=Teleopsis dalmanni TaxID=139649 RepID=UPI0018CF5321|nr:uncharacterized protein LOC119677696 [Teleopsis dalmanni]